MYVFIYIISPGLNEIRKIVPIYSFIAVSTKCQYQIYQQNEKFLKNILPSKSTVSCGLRIKLTLTICVVRAVIPDGRTVMINYVCMYDDIVSDINIMIKKAKAKLESLRSFSLVFPLLF